MEDVAREAQVSRALVSLVMRGSDKVSEERRRRVWEVASRLGYRPNLSARNLASRRTQTVGVVLNDLHNPFFAEIFDGISDGAERRGYRLLLSTGGRRAAAEEEAMDGILEHRTDGMIMVSPRIASAPIVTASESMPTVVIGRLVRAMSVDSVLNDEAEGARLAVAHLAALGHEQILHIDGGKGAGAPARRRGYVAAMRASGLGDHVDVLSGDFTEVAGIEATRKLLRRLRRPTAIFGANDLVAAGVIDELDSAGVAVPEDVSVIGYDNSFVARMQHMSITTIDQPREQMGGRALDLLLERVEAGRTKSAVDVLRPSLVVRRTTGPVPDGRRQRQS
jgi:DNA-binding LacI/PurR family transcriptional regulator